MCQHLTTDRCWVSQRVAKFAKVVMVANVPFGAASVTLNETLEIAMKGVTCPKKYCGLAAARLCEVATPMVLIPSKRFEEAECQPHDPRCQQRSAPFRCEGFRCAKYGSNYVNTMLPSQTACILQPRTCHLLCPSA
jgi:hypothetical protein